MLDALTYVKAARANGVPAALEISQSGRGAHVWVFFTGAVPAAVARSVGTALIQVDECHHLAAAAYEHSVKRIGAQFWLGLTATPTRRDGLDELVTWQLGPVRHTITHDTTRDIT